MSVWDIYESRIISSGDSQRSRILKREKQYISNKIINSLSYYDVIIDGEKRNVSIMNSDNLNEKIIYSLPGEDLKCGGVVEWANNHWIISEKDANNEVYSKAKLIQCNYLLRWVDKYDDIHEQWCFIEDGTKYLTGEYEDRNFVVTRGDSRIAMTISKNKYTANFVRENRFIIDDPDSQNKIAYLLTKPLKVGKTFNGEGVYSFVLQEVVTTEDDNLELGIADYYKHFPKSTKSSNNQENGLETTGKKVWI